MPVRLPAGLVWLLSNALVGLTLTVGAGALWLEDRRDAIPSAWDPFAPIVFADPDTPVQRWKLATTAADPVQCRAALEAGGVAALPVEATPVSVDCTREGAFTLTGLGGVAIAPVDTRCPVALALAVWRARVLAPAAQDHLGAELTALDHYGGYACRKIAGTARWSEHARANAVDIAGFRFSDGRRITLTAGWGGDDAAADAFLRAARDGACPLFSAVLGPEYNDAHRDHFHLDLGRWRVCR